MKYLTQISKSGWGIFLIIAGVISVILDLVVAGGGMQTRDLRGESVPMFPPFGFTLGWLGVVLVLIVPALVFRAARKRPIPKGVAFVWCALFAFGWLCVKALMADGSPPQAGIAAIACIALCWRLLTWEEEKFPSPPAANPAPEKPEPSPPMEERRRALLELAKAGMEMTSPASVAPASAEQAPPENNKPAKTNKAGNPHKYYLPIIAVLLLALTATGYDSMRPDKWKGLKKGDVISVGMVIENPLQKGIFTGEVRKLEGDWIIIRAREKTPWLEVFSDLATGYKHFPNAQSIYDNSQLSRSPDNYIASVLNSKYLGLQSNEVDKALREARGPEVWDGIRQRAAAALGVTKQDPTDIDLYHAIGKRLRSYKERADTTEAEVEKLLRGDAQ